MNGGRRLHDALVLENDSCLPLVCSVWRGGPARGKKAGRRVEDQQSAWRDGTQQTDKDGQDQKTTEEQRELAHWNLYMTIRDAAIFALQLIRLQMQVCRKKADQIGRAMTGSSLPCPALGASRQVSCLSF